ncbi:MAG: ribonuclease H-like domain-containing protein [Patescibacteria group bacterium]
MSYIVLDLETQREFSEIGGRNKVHLLGVSVVGTYDSEEDKYRAYREEELNELEQKLSRKPMLVGFNIKGFDIPVLQPHLSLSLVSLPVVDIMDDLALSLGYRVSLESVARGTLGKGKTGHGLEAIRLYREGKWDELIEYCLQDVRLTKEIYEYGREKGYVKFFAGWETYEVPVKWK